MVKNSCAVLNSDVLSLLYRALAFVGLAIIALGTGGIKPCVSAFGGDQFQESQVTTTYPVHTYHLQLFTCI